MVESQIPRLGEFDDINDEATFNATINDRHVAWTENDGIFLYPSSFWINIEVSGIVCFGTPDAFIIRSGADFSPIAFCASIAPILSTSISEILLSKTPVLDTIQSSDLFIFFDSSFDVSILGGR